MPMFRQITIICFLHDDDYPLQLNQLFDPPPVLFYRGNVARLRDPQIAIVGSRKPTEHAQKFTLMAQYLSDKGYHHQWAAEVDVMPTLGIGTIAR